MEALRRGETVRIEGDVGGRLGSSLGVDLAKLGGKGGPIETTGRIIVEGDIGSRMGISMIRGSIYTSGSVGAPLGNVLEVDSDLSGYRKFVSITEVLERGGRILSPNRLEDERLVLKDRILRETLAARNRSYTTLRVEGDAGMSAGILMRSGLLEILGDAGKNTGVLMRGGRIVVCGSCSDFTAAEMRGGEIFVAGDAGGYICAGMVGGAVYATRGRPIPPAKAQPLKGDEVALVSRALGVTSFQAMICRRFGL
ncbi:tributyrin esterase [Candidatus Methanocrinis natronophilus]|uniref:Tributyrin esterase n=1 Tax=Candidatus Methanocrinis natronophilus TaxID=3033396 RepID=A0ABT5X6N5_9EURY|nr:tributyrin esterase [Candidatus Methanocrinis natronophilus]MDF0590350.1 tributyrin esterase [Candidatus Methanocrinis natronophilus]